MPTASELSVVIPTRNRSPALRRLLDSLGRSTHHPSEVIVVDDASVDETRRFTETGFPFPLRIMHLSHHVMMAEARNAGARTARGSFILFIDDDNVLDRSMIAMLLDTAYAHPEYGMLGPVMYTLSTGRIQTAYQRFNLTSGHTYGPALVPPSELVASDGIPNVFLVRREVFDRCGYFDESLMATYSEIDLDFRARRAGYQCGIVTAAKTFHDNHPHRALLPRTMGGGTFLQKSYCMIRNRMVMVRRYGRVDQQLLFFAFFSWVWPLLYSAMMIRYRRFDLIHLYWKGFCDGIMYAVSGRLVNSFRAVPPAKV